jgi:hypothetical protein
MLLRLAYLGITNAFALLRLPPGGDRDKGIEILSLRHQIAVLQRHLDGQQIRFEPVDWAWRAALLRPLPRSTLRRLRLLVQPDTILKWHRDLIARRHAARSRPRRRGRPRTLRSIRALALRLARERGTTAGGTAGCTANCSRSESRSPRRPSGRSCTRLASTRRPTGPPPHGQCPAPGLMETSKPGRNTGDGRTEEVQR